MTDPSTRPTPYYDPYDIDRARSTIARATPAHPDQAAIDQDPDPRAATLAALRDDGYDPTNLHEGAEWLDRRCTWLPDGHQSVVTITSLGKTITGWQVRVTRRQVDQAGDTVPSGDGGGIIYVEHLLADYQPYQPPRRLG